MQKSGKNLIEIMRELQDAVSVADNVALAYSAVEEVKATVGQLAKAAKHVEHGDVHLALALINDVRRSNDLCACPPPLLPESRIDYTGIWIGTFWGVHASRRER